MWVLVQEARQGEDRAHLEKCAAKWALLPGQENRDPQQGWGSGSAFIFPPAFDIRIQREKEEEKTQINASWYW